MSDATQKKDVSSSLSKLSLGKPKSKPREPVADSWEDEGVSDSDGEVQNSHAKKSSQSLPSAPPPTPISPSYNNKTDGSWPPANYPGPSFSGGGFDAAERKRPEKTDVVLRRMLAGDLGMNAMKPTAEQKAHDKAVRERVKRQREEEKEAERRRQEEAQKAKAAIWED